MCLFCIEFLISEISNTLFDILRTRVASYLYENWQFICASRPEMLDRYWQNVRARYFIQMWSESSVVQLECNNFRRDEDVRKSTGLFFAITNKRRGIISLRDVKPSIVSREFPDFPI